MTTHEAIKLVDAVQGTSLAALWHGINLHQACEPLPTNGAALTIFESEDRRPAHQVEAPVDE